MNALVGPLCQWGQFSDEQLRPDASFSGLQMAGARYYDSATGKWVDRFPEPKNAYRPVHIGDAIIGLEAGVVNALWKSVAAPIVDAGLKARGLTDLNPAQQKVVDRFLNPCQIDQSNFVQRGFAIPGEGVGFAIGSIAGAKGGAGALKGYGCMPGLGMSRPMGGTYALVARSGRVIRTGRTNDFARRAMEPQRTYGDTLEFVRDLESANPLVRAIREQRISDRFAPIIDKRSPIGPRNPIRFLYEGMRLLDRLPGGALDSRR